LVNMEGTWQATRGAGHPPGEARPAWKVLRVLGNQLGLAGFEWNTLGELTRTARERVASSPGHGDDSSGYILEEKGGDSPARVARGGIAEGGLWHVPEPAACQMDALMRHASSLQATVHAKGDAMARIHPQSAREHGIMASGEVEVRQGGRAVRIWLELDEGVAQGVVVSAWPGPMTAALGRSRERIELMAMPQEALVP
jgi:NADH-quinone oxidoreductase subunit G